MTKAFSPGSEAVAAMPFTYAGTRYAKGERFPYRDLGVIDYDLRGLWAAERIEFVPKPYAIQQQKPTQPQPQQRR